MLQLGVTASVVCLAAGITAITLASSAAVFAFLLAGVAPYAVAFAVQGSQFSEVIAATIVIFVAGISLLARNNFRLFAELIALRLDVAAQRDAAQQANQAKSRFLAAASHDLRQPLHAMTLLASALDGCLQDAVYVANLGDGTNPGSVSQFTIGASGALSPMTPASVAAGVNARSVTVDPTGRWVYVANEGDLTNASTVSQYDVAPDGALTPMATATIGAGVRPYAIVSTATYP